MQVVELLAQGLYQIVSSEASLVRKPAAGQSKRPVSWSLQRWFKPSNPGASSQSVVAVQAEAASESWREQSWKKKQEAENQALAAAVQLAQVSQSQTVQIAPRLQLRVWRGGRPKQRRSGKKNVHLSGQQRVWAVQFLEDYLQIPGHSKKSGFQTVARKLFCNIKTIQRTWAKKVFWKHWAELEERKPSVREGTNKRRGQRVPNRAANSKGARIPGERGYLGRTDHCREFTLLVQVWAELEQSHGHQLFRPDLVRKYRQLLDSAILFADQAQAEGTFNPDKSNQLAAWKQKQASLDIKSKRDKQGKVLVEKTGFVERSKQRQTPLTVAQEVERVQRSWAHWDTILWLTGCADSPQLRDWVGQPERWVFNRENTVISMSDQIPVWLKPDAGKVLVHKSVGRASRQSAQQRKRRKACAEGEEQNEEAAEEQPRTLTVAAGNPANSRSRFTFVARQLVLNYYKPGAEPEG